MASKIFLDANILLDFTLKRENYSIVKKLLELVVEGSVRAFVSPSIVHILGYWLGKAYGNAKAKEILLTLLADVFVIDIDHRTTVLALHSRIKDIEDALQYYTAINHKIEFFISRDKSLKKEASPSLPVMEPDEFLKKIIRIK